MNNLVAHCLSSLSTPAQPISNSVILVKSTPHFIQELSIRVRKTVHCTLPKMAGIKATIFFLVYSWVRSSIQGRVAGGRMRSSVSTLSS